MALKRPPAHRVDAEAVYIHKLDSAWDMERVERERSECDEPHPFDVYYDGDTRFDLDAQIQYKGEFVCVRDYLDPGQKPVMFRLKRLDWQQWYQVQSSMAKDVVAGAVEAFRMGVAEIDGDPGLRLDPRMSKVPDAVMQKLCDLDSDIPVLGGLAVVRSSEPLRPDEGKR